MLASRVLMVRPAHFYSNPETRSTNAFQDQSGQVKAEDSVRALKEFDTFKKLLVDAGIEVFELNDDRPDETPDSIFPNNWISFHPKKKIILYPMMAENRRRERRKDWIQILQKKFEIREVIDLSTFENEGVFLEGTGSMILDWKSHTAFAALSSRTHRKAFESFCRQFDFEPVSFHATDENEKEIYHTNVMMAVGESEAILCSASIRDASVRTAVIEKLKGIKKEVVEISFEQMRAFAGNCLQLKNRNGQKFWVGSRAALDSFEAEQRNILSKSSKWITPQLDTIERLGGGGARCMLCEVY